MAKYRLRIKKSARKELEAIDSKTDRLRIVERISSLATEPRPRGASKLSGQERYRIRQGKYRILYTIEDDLLVICVIKVADRKNVYKSLSQ